MEKTIYIGIRREDKSVWERRVALPPVHVKEIMEKNPELKFIVQPSAKRVFKDKEYEKAGATIQEDISSASVIIGVKEIPLTSFLDNRTYIFFAHVIKAQLANMQALDLMLEKKIRFIDYEPIKDDSGKRLVAFGQYAGNAGCIDLLHGIGEVMLANGFSTPFLQIGMTYSYYNLADAKDSITKIAKRVHEEEIPVSYRPLIFAVTGQGRCADGCYEILDLLPHKKVEPKELAALVANKDDPAHATTIYLVNVLSEHMVEHEDPTKPFNKAEYYEYPNHFKPVFADRYLPYISCLFNCIYWDSRFPRLVTCAEMKTLVQEKKSRLFGISDITCDFEGSVEFLKKFTTIEKPFYMWDAVNEKMIDDFHTFPTGILYQSIDHLPSELPYDASMHFGSKLKDFIAPIAKSDPTKPLKEQNLPKEIERAVVTLNGELAENFRYIVSLRQTNERLKSEKNYTSVQPPPVLKRVKSFASVKLKGHLFDSFAINKIVDALTAKNINYSFVDWKIGRNNDETSHVILQIFSKNTETFDEVMESLDNIGETCNLEMEINM